MYFFTLMCVLCAVVPLSQDICCVIAHCCVFVYLGALVDRSLDVYASLCVYGGMLVPVLVFFAVAGAGAVANDGAGAISMMSLAIGVAVAVAAGAAFVDVAVADHVDAAVGADGSATVVVARLHDIPSVTPTTAHYTTYQASPPPLPSVTQGRLYHDSKPEPGKETQQ